jgi:hypothetical protein
MYDIYECHKTNSPNLPSVRSIGGAETQTQAGSLPCQANTPAFSTKAYAQARLHLPHQESICASSKHWQGSFAPYQPHAQGESLVSGGVASVQGEDNMWALSRGVVADGRGDEHCLLGWQPQLTAIAAGQRGG